jgi:small-conductance mechanosensitive channel
METALSRAEAIWQQTHEQLTTPEFYLQFGMVLAAIIIASLLTSAITSRAKFFQNGPESGGVSKPRVSTQSYRRLLLLVLITLALSIAAPISADLIGKVWLVRAAQGLALVFLVYSLIRHVINDGAVVLILKWIGLPLALFYMLGWLDDVVVYLEGISVDLGNIHISLYAIFRTVVFGIVLFWLGRLSNTVGQRVIRNQFGLEVGTREVMAKLFQIGLFALIFLLLLNIMGIDLTALAVFGGALGVGLGFGLQQIASNFISGIIILIDRSITIGDYIELEDGRAGTLRELTMRSATLETFDGKDIMVPNEQFITTVFTNWTHNDKKQRYSLNFQVAYNTDLPKLFGIVRDTVASHPKVLSGEGVPAAQQPDAEIEAFGDSGIDILVEYWMEGIDDGENRVGADLLLMIWTTLKSHQIEIPFPQREVKILGDEKS